MMGEKQKSEGSNNGKKEIEKKEKRREGGNAKGCVWGSHPLGQDSLGNMGPSPGSCLGHSGHQGAAAT